jgi:acyl-CoA synthetase (AMP-forming)/AMP-acid ligase II
MQGACGPPLQGTFQTISEALSAAAGQFADREAYVAGDQRLTFGQWARAADGVAAVLAERGVQPGDVVAIMLPPSVEYAIACAAITRIGAVATGVNTRLGRREVEAIFTKAEPALAFVGAGEAPPGLPGWTVTIEPAALWDAATGPPLRGSRHFGKESDPALIIWTSGTTGVPKGAWFDHAGLRAAATTAGVMTGPFDRRLVSTPLAAAGYMAKVWEQLAWGTTLVLSPLPWRERDMLRLIIGERITVAAAVPTQWARFLALPELADADLSALRLVIASTAPMPPDLAERVVDRCGCPLVMRYAMTESPSITGTRPGDPLETQFRTVGRPQAGVEISIRDDHGRPLANGATGRMHVRSAHMMRGYWQEPDLTSEVFDDAGWLRGGDLGHIDDDGNLVLAGRVDDMYIRGGYNVYPLEVENVLAEHPGVDRVAVIGASAPVLGEIGVAFVVPARAAAPPTIDELRAWCRARLAYYKAPDRMVLLDALPQTAMMKVDKVALQEMQRAFEESQDLAKPGSSRS